MLGFLPADMKKSFVGIFDYVLGNLRVGLPGHQKRATNLQWYQLDSETPANANEEFSVEHGLQNPPRVLFPCLDLTSAGAQMVPLQTSRAADGKRIYLKSASTAAPFTVFVESRD